MQSSSMFIGNCKIVLHVSAAFCVQLQEHLETVEAASGEWRKDGVRYQTRRPRSMASTLSHTQYDLVRGLL